MRLRCLIGWHEWVRERFGSYLYCRHCKKYNIWRTLDDERGEIAALPCKAAAKIAEASRRRNRN